MDINRRKGSKHRILSQEQIQIVHESTLELLERTGVQVQCAEAIEVLKQSGCDVSNARQVKIPRKLVAKAIEAAPKSIQVYDRDGNPALALQEDTCYYGTGSDCTHHIDLFSGKRRTTTKEDVGNLARFCDALPNIDFVMSMGIAYDTPRGTSFVHQYEAMLLNTKKPVIVTAHGQKDMKTIIDMAAVAIGGLDAVGKQPPLILYSEPFSPLTHTEMGVAKCLLCCEYGVPFIYIPSPMMGATGPITYAGTLVQANAECLSGLVIFQAKYPGAKFIYGGDATGMDMRHTVYIYSGPEINVLNVALADLAHFYKLPFFCIAGATDSKVPDAQAGIEYALSLYNATLNGCNLIHDCGYLESGRTSSFESILMADEIIAFIKHLLKPFEITSETIALDVINEIGTGKTYLSHRHTLKNLRKDLWFPRFLDRSVFDNWEKAGAKDLRQRLREEAQKIQEGHSPPLLPQEISQQIQLMVRKHIPDV